MRTKMIFILIVLFLSPQGCSDKFVKVTSIGSEELDIQNHIELDNIAPNIDIELENKVSNIVGVLNESKDRQGDRYINSQGMEFVFISPGIFEMGSPRDEEYWDPDEQQHLVALSRGYFLQTTEVTRKQWRSVMGPYPRLDYSCEDCPMVNVSWNLVKIFIKKLNNRQREVTYRLPTEAEWEYACRAGTTTPFSFGECLSIEEANFNSANPFLSCSTNEPLEKAVEVTSYPPNSWGLYDMHGNVWEWCQDVFGEYPSIAVTDPVCSIDGENRVVRGGSYINDAVFCRSAYRFKATPKTQGEAIGFRLACNWRTRKEK